MVRQNFWPSCMLALITLLKLLTALLEHFDTVGRKYFTLFMLLLLLLAAAAACCCCLLLLLAAAASAI